MTYEALKECKTCGQGFAIRSANQRYCSVACQRGTAVCQSCGKTFQRARHARGFFCSTECCYEQKQPTGSRKAMNGYMIIKVPRGTPGCITYGATLDRWMFEHRYVMQQVIGRTLDKDETVHHKNGDKMDNRPENLELWTGRHGRGVRVDDVHHCPGCRCFEQQVT